MLDKNFIKNITSKDTKLSLNTITTLIKTSDIALFEHLCEKADFIFPFLKERIIKDFIKLINKEDLKTVFEFSKIYSSDFEEIIVGSWVKFASEDLTDEILELFEKGTNEQKAYCAKYFSRIQDPLALEYLKKEVKTDFEPLMTNCAQTLFVFKDTEVLDEMKEVVLKSDDDFEKFAAFNFINAYGGENQIKFIVENAFSSPFLVNIISNMMDANGFNYLKTILSNEKLLEILYIIIDEYPEDIALDSVMYWDILEFLKLIETFDNQFAKNILLLANDKFGEFSTNDIYLFDLDKNTKEEVKKISNYLNSINISFDEVVDNLDCSSTKQIDCVLEVIKRFKISSLAQKTADLFNQNKLNLEQMAHCAEVLKEINAVDLIDRAVVESVENENIKALIESYLS